MASMGERGSPAASGVTVNSRSSPSRKLGHQALTGDSQLVQTLAVNEPGMGRTEVAQRFRHGPEPLRIIYASELPADLGRIGERAEQVEDRARTQLDARACGMAEGGMVPGREQEDAAGLLHHGRQAVKRNVHVHAQRRQHVGAPGQRGQVPVAVLRHWHAAARQDEGDSRGHIQGPAAVAARAANVHRVRRRGNGRHPGAHGTHGAGQFRHRFAPDSHRHQQPGHLRRRGLPRHDDAESRLGLLGGQGGAVRQAREDRLEAGQATPRGPAYARLARWRRGRWRGSWPGCRGRARRRCSRGGTARRTPASPGAAAP